MKKYIKELLDRKQIKQKELASILGISSAAISQWLTPESVGVENIYKICKLFSITIDEFLNKKLKDETIDEKVERLYCIDNYNFEEIIENEDIDALLDFTCKLRNINESMYDLLYLKMTNRISDSESQELNYIYKYFEYNVNNSRCFDKNKYVYFLGEDRDFKIAEQIKKMIDANDKNDFIWELKKIYNIKNKIKWDDVINKQNLKLFSLQAIENVLKSYTEMELNEVYEKYSIWGTIEMKEILFSVGANDLYKMGYCSFLIENKDFEKIEGVLTPAVKYNEIDKILAKHMINKNSLSYDEYHKIINYDARELVKLARMKENNPIKYWECIKNRKY